MMEKPYGPITQLSHYLAYDLGFLMMLNDPDLQFSRHKKMKDYYNLLIERERRVVAESPRKRILTPPLVRKLNELVGAIAKKNTGRQ